MCLCGLELGSNQGVISDNLDEDEVGEKEIKRKKARTEPMERKKPKEAALLSMYLDNVDKTP
jgi:hypothetical protein